MRKFLLVLIVFMAASCHSKRPDTGSGMETPKCKYGILDSLDSRVKNEHIPATNVLSLSFSGNYQKHPEAYGQLMGYASKHYAFTGGIIGIYPQDPDLISDESQLQWEITLRVLPGQPGVVDNSKTASKNSFETTTPEGALSVPLSELKTPEKPYALKTLPPTEAITLVSDIAHIGRDGLAINAWIDLNNYVQTGTTRTEFGAANQESRLIPVKIIVPVRKRISEVVNK